MTTASKKKPKYDYLVLSFALTDLEIPIWEALFEQDREILSANIYSMITHEKLALAETASHSQPRNGQKTYFRKLFLLPLPEYKKAVSFVRHNIRRPAFKEHLKQLILYKLEQYKKEQLDRIITKLARNDPAPEVSMIPESAKHLLIQSESIIEKSALRNPRDLFSEPSKLLQIIVLDVKRPEADRLFSWDAIPPEDYPEAVRRGAAFSRLEKYWKEKNIIPRRPD